MAESAFNSAGRADIGQPPAWSRIRQLARWSIIVCSPLAFAEDTPSASPEGVAAMSERQALVMPWLSVPTQAYLYTAEPKMRFEQVVIQGASLIPAAELSDYLSPLLGQTLSLEEIQAAMLTLSELYRERGLSARARLMKQDLFGGTLHVRVVERSHTKRGWVAATESSGGL
ncbi:hypothetical protein LG409_08540 [Halomonas sp. NyZ770]|uniref:POTRA domain-containing protein n=1 Tax=Halomonas sp. NyZ770 TaxID=2883106 RepID=UPI001D0A60FE|nr:POTRA domain-containing protein [Halomonas sp. NyZ770]UDM08929.1 hypothetical protein LG409_08540 [Halomonas sp. NyZ770]